LAGWLTDWLAGWLADWLAGWLAGWLVGCLGATGTGRRGGKGEGKGPSGRGLSALGWKLEEGKCMKVVEVLAPTYPHV